MTPKIDPRKLKSALEFLAKDWWSKPIPPKVFYAALKKHGVDAHRSAMGAMVLQGAAKKVGWWIGETRDGKITIQKKLGEEKSMLKELMQEMQEQAGVELDEAGLPHHRQFHGSGKGVAENAKILSGRLGVMSRAAASLPQEEYDPSLEIATAAMIAVHNDLLGKVDFIISAIKRGDKSSAQRTAKTLKAAVAKIDPLYIQGM